MRYYDPEIGRYISRDPIGYPDGLNNWLYVNNNPICRIDPQGLGWFSDAWDYAVESASAAAGAVVGAAKTVVVGTAQVAYNAAGSIAYSVSGNEAYKEQYDASLRTADAIGNMVAHPIKSSEESYERVMQTYETKGAFAGGEAFGEETMSRYMLAKTAYSGAKTAYNMVRPNAPTADPNAVTPAEQAMVDNLVRARQAAGKAENGRATFAQGQGADGQLTPVRESVPGAGPEGHAEALVKADLPGGRGTIAVDQYPCAPPKVPVQTCCKTLTANNRVVVPQNPQALHLSPKTAAVGAAQGLNTVQPKVVNPGPPTPPRPPVPPTLLVAPPTKKE